MRISRIAIGDWRNFREIEVRPPAEESLICLIGENGSGKSNFLELLAACAQFFGISAGIEIPRGSVFAEPHEAVEVEFFLPGGFGAVFEGVEAADLFDLSAGWDRTLILNSGSSQGTRVFAGGIQDPAAAQNFASAVVNQLNQRQEVNHLYLDADRSYPAFVLATHLYVEALERDLTTPQAERQWAFKSSRSLYEDWLKYFLGREGQMATEFVRRVRAAQDADEPQPPYEDPFASFKASVSVIFPHLRFEGVDTQRRQILFDSAGTELPFSALSGGEREIAFLIGQVERFQLRRGLLLVDEPEMHLNADLLRLWLSFLRDTVVEGQVWIASHSLEAAEVAGPSAAYVFERDDDRLVRSVAPVAERPLLRTLANAVGSPAFSLRDRRFILIEGERQDRERERYVRMCGATSETRFVEAGGCEAVTRKLAATLELAEEADDQLRVGAVIDRDFRTIRQVNQLKSAAPVYVLECHEIENLLLHPDALQWVSQHVGQGNIATSLVEASDRFAGLWVVRRALTLLDSRVASTPLRQAAGSTTLATLAADPEAERARLAALQAELDGDEEQELADRIRSSIERYAEIRESDELWRWCLGKETLGTLPSSFGLTNTEMLERLVYRAWQEAGVDVPAELASLRAYVDGVGA